MISPFREIVSVWTKVRPAWISDLREERKTPETSPLRVLHELAQRRGQPTPTEASRNRSRPHDDGAAVSPARAVAFAVLRGSSSRTPGPTGRCTGEARRAGLDARDRALATQLAYGAVQRGRHPGPPDRGPGGPAGRAAAGGARRPAARRLPGRASWTASPPTPRSASRSSWPRPRPAGRGAGQRRAAPRRARGTRARGGAARRDAPRRPRCGTRIRPGSPSSGSRRSERRPRAS